MSITCPKCNYTRTSDDQTPEYECPSCGVIYSKAKQRPAIPSSPASIENNGQNEPWRPFGHHPIVVMGAVSFVFAAAWIYGSSETKTRTPEPQKIDSFSAMTECERYVTHSLKAPSTASFAPYGDLSITGQGNGPYTVVGWVDAQNSFGAMLRNRYSCTVLFSGDSSVQLLDLSIK